MLKIKLTAGSMYINESEAQAVEHLQRILPQEEGYIIPVMFVGKRVTNREIDAILLLPDAIFLLDFKDWLGERVEVEGINGAARRLRRGSWEKGDNSLPDYEYAAREIATRLKRERQWLPIRPRIYSVMVFTGDAPVSFAGGDPNNPQPKDGVGACRLEQFPQLLKAFRAAQPTPTLLTSSQCSTLAKTLLEQAKEPSRQVLKRIDDYKIIAEHHTDTFLNCKIYLGEGELFNELVWIKEYEQVFAAPAQRNKREQLVLRHADILRRFPQHPNIVDYRLSKSTASHLYIVLSRKPGAFLSELLSQKPTGLTTQADLERIPFDLSARLQILGGLLNALEYLTQQPGFEHSAYRDLRPDSIFIQFTSTTPVAQLFNFDCTKLPGSATKFSHLKAGAKRSPLWDDYASPELLEYIESDHTDHTNHTNHTNSGTSLSFTGGIKSDLFSWAIIAWELLTGELPFPDTQAKQAGERRPWLIHPSLQQQAAASHLAPEAIRLLQACLEPSAALRPTLSMLRSHFP